MRVEAPVPLTVAGAPAQGPEPIEAPLSWDGPGAPRHVRNVSVPTLTAYLPDADVATGAGVVVCPGGAMHFLSVENEGEWVARLLVQRGVAAFVLHYRTVPTPPDEVEWAALAERSMSDRAYMLDVGERYRPVAAADGGAAVGHVRAHAERYGVRPDRVGMLGFSAGGFVVAATTLDAPDEHRPDFVAPVYPALWGPAVVPQPAPPMFLAWASDDDLGDAIVDSSLTLYRAWWAAGGSVEAHAYATGGHGFGATPRGTRSDRWFADFSAWLDAVVLATADVRRA
ncbi:alpha/beta hydrolase [Cellulomonas marina]|uniref:Acetyl esterase/lipase n=1 Tax=Cellulomonas marina TaxID=988821 RepID=A0A1I0X3Z1_9CELL|nr:alpha/beta hydrolase [Cellulomonas marina]GIG28911.1 xylanase [Cellulomonas marina]SFA95367.1 Acetyl esterase/lipase [Cellulomonas marina]